AIPNIIKKRTEAFSNKFKTIFKLSRTFNDDQIKFGKYALSNLFGGVGYFYGDSVNVREGFGVDPPPGSLEPVEAHALFASVPCRPFFPRGFLWDEGFQLLIIQAWDTSFRMGGSVESKYLELKLGAG
ncbi:Processing alpha glucosidase I, partial [Gonapodya sp. JEL0774]